MMGKKVLEPICKKGQNTVEREGKHGIQLVTGRLGLGNHQRPFLGGLLRQESTWEAMADGFCELEF